MITLLSGSVMMLFLTNNILEFIAASLILAMTAPYNYRVLAEKVGRSPK